jgi:hypothetical protein
MQFSTQTLELYNQIKTFSKNKIKNEDDLCFLIELSNTQSQHSVFNEITFYAKYLNGLTKILQSGQIGSLRRSDLQQVKTEETLLKIKGEYTGHLKKLINLLEQYISGTNPEQAEKFKKKYLDIKMQTLRNLNSLIYDLTWVKNHSNKFKK